MKITLLCITLWHSSEALAVFLRPESPVATIAPEAVYFMVLFIDDDPQDQATVAMTLAGRYTVLAAGSASEGLRLLRPDGAGAPGHRPVGPRALPAGETSWSFRHRRR